MFQNSELICTDERWKQSKGKGPSTHDEEFANEYSTKNFSSWKIFLNIKFAKANQQV